MPDIQTLLNIGPAIAKKLEKIKITTVEEFKEQDPYDIFKKLQDKVDPSLCHCALASIVGAHVNIPWHKITKKTALEYEKRYPNFKWQGKC